jgi:hypothetical protein
MVKNEHTGLNQLKGGKMRFAGGAVGGAIGFAAGAALVGGGMWAASDLTSNDSVLAKMARGYSKLASNAGTEQNNRTLTMRQQALQQLSQSAYDALKAMADSLNPTHMGTALRKFIGAHVHDPHDGRGLTRDPKDTARGFSPTIDFSIPTPPDNTTLDILSNKTQELPESNPPSESETPFFFTDVKQLKVKKNKKKKSEKTKSSKSKRK